MYIDELILLNYIIDYCLLYSEKEILKINVKNNKILLGALCGEISILYLFINMNTFVLWLFKALIGILIIYISFGYKDKQTFIKNIIWFYMLSFFLGGALYYFKIEDLVKYQYILLLIPFILNIFKYFAYNLKNYVSLKHKVTIYLKNGKSYYFDGYIDTGNCLIEPYYGRKVIIINKKITEDFFLVPYNTINNESLLKCFIPKKVFIEGIGERNDIAIGIINKKFIGYDCLLNYKLLEE